MKTTITIKDVVREYVKSREEIERLEDELAEKLKEIKKLQAMREEWMLGELRKGEQESVRTDEGTVYRLTKESVKVADWDEFLDEVIVVPVVKMLLETYFDDMDDGDKKALTEMVREEMKAEFLNKAANKTACLEVMGERVKEKGRPNLPPKGISYTAFETVGVRKG